MKININADALVRYTERLERLHRSALPVAIRSTLNDLAFDVKNVSLQKSATKNFVRRSPNFFKTFSGVDKALGFNIRSMKSIVGMTANGKGKAAEAAVSNMEKQEYGGVASKGSRYLSDARGGNNSKKVVKSNYFKNGRTLTGPSRRRTKKSHFVAMAFASKKYKAKFFHDGTRSNFIMQVTMAKKSKDGKIIIKAKKLMMSRNGSPANIKATYFMREAATASVQKVELFYRKRAEDQFKRILRQ